MFDGLLNEKEEGGNGDGDGGIAKIRRILFHFFVKCLRVFAFAGMMLHLFFIPKTLNTRIIHKIYLEIFRCCQSKLGRPVKLISNIKRLKIYLPENKCEYKKTITTESKRETTAAAATTMTTITMKTETTEESISFSLK